MQQTVSTDTLCYNVAIQQLLLARRDCKQWPLRAACCMLSPPRADWQMSLCRPPDKRFATLQLNARNRCDTSLREAFCRTTWCVSYVPSGLCFLVPFGAHAFVNAL